RPRRPGRPPAGGWPRRRSAPPRPSSGWPRPSLWPATSQRTTCDTSFRGKLTVTARHPLCRTGADRCCCRSCRAGGGCRCVVVCCVCCVAGRTPAVAVSTGCGGWLRAGGRGSDRHGRLRLPPGKSPRRLGQRVVELEAEELGVGLGQRVAQRRGRHLAEEQ